MQDPVTGKHIYTDPLDGSKLEWDAVKNAWVPLFDDEFLANYQEQDLILIIKKMKGILSISNQTF